MGSCNVASAQTREAPARIAVDATDWSRHILHVRLTLPTRPGPVTLYFPKWIPGTHRPEGNTADLAGLTIDANGERLRWNRDTLDNYAFHCKAPPGTRSLDVAYDALNAQSTPEMGFAEWNGQSSKGNRATGGPWSEANRALVTAHQEVPSAVTAGMWCSQRTSGKCVTSRALLAGR